MIVMARILTPADYGIVGMVLIFISIAQSLVDSGFTHALIRKQDRSETDNSTAFYFNIAVGLILYIALWFLAPAVAKFYNEPRLVWITRVICLGIIFNSLVVVQRALLTVEIDFKTQAKASMIAAFSAGVAGIVMAYTGFGVWSIVAYHVINLGFNCILLWLLSSWRPAWIYSWKSFKSLFSFGSNIAIAALLNTLYLNAFNMAIGKVYKAADLGFYTRGQQFVAFFSSNISSIFQKVSYPALCKFQDDNEKLREVFLRMIRITSFVVFAMMMGLFGVARPMIISFLGEKWSYAATLMQILCFAFMWFSVYSLNFNLLMVKGRSDLCLKLEIVKKILFVGVLCATIPLGLEAMCWGQVLNAVMEVYINSFFTAKLIGLSLWRQLRALVPALIYTVSMGAVVWLVTGLFINSWIQLTVGVATGILYIFVVCKLTGSRDLKEMLKLVKR